MQAAAAAELLEHAAYATVKFTCQDVESDQSSAMNAEQMSGQKRTLLGYSSQT